MDQSTESEFVGVARASVVNDDRSIPNPISPRLHNAGSAAASAEEPGVEAGEVEKSNSGAELGERDQDKEPEEFGERSAKVRRKQKEPIEQ